MDDARLSVYERHHPLGAGKPEDVAAAVAFLLSADARFVTGQVLAVDGGLSCHLPTYADFVEQGWEL